MRTLFLALCLAAGAAAADPKVVLVITADASDFVHCAGGTIATMVERGAAAHLIRVTNDEKDSWRLSPEETARRVREEVEQAARALGIEKVHHLGYRAGELASVSPTELRDRIAFYVRLLKPDVMFLPNPYAEYVEVLDRYYTGSAAEEARRAASLANYQPPFAQVGLEPHFVPELYHYAAPVDPRRREPESTATFVPQPVTRDIAAAFDRKLRAALALRTINYSLAMRIRQRLEETGRRLPLLDTVDDAAVAKLVEINLRRLAAIGAEKTAFQLAEEFHYAGLDYQIPQKYRGASQ